MRRVVMGSLLLLLTAVNVAFAIDPTEPFEDPEKQEVYARITKEVRCLVCQNQTIADSTAPLAADLRREIRRLIEEGESEMDIKMFLVERYGDFVLYKPLFRSWNIALWLAPAVLLLIGIVAIARTVRRRAQLPIDEDAP